MSFFSNPWVIGIGGGILSGVAVTWLSRILFSQKNNKEYLQKVISADQDVVYSLRPLISESTFPSIGILNSLISATSKKYKIDQKDMLSASEFLDQLIKEVMDSSFIPNDKKSEYCTHLISIKSETTVHRIVENSELNIVSKYREESSKTLSSTIGLMVTIMTMVAVVLQTKSSALFTIDLINTFLLPIGVALLASLVAVVTMSNQNKESKQKIKKIISDFLP